MFLRLSAGNRSHRRHLWTPGQDRALVKLVQNKENYALSLISHEILQQFRLPEALLAALALLSCAVTLLLLPETGGKPLPASMEEIKKRRSEKKEEEEKPTQ